MANKTNNDTQHCPVTIANSITTAYLDAVKQQNQCCSRMEQKKQNLTVCLQAFPLRSLALESIF